MNFISMTDIDNIRFKPPKSDMMNNYANNTNDSVEGQGYPEVINYFNFYHTDELI